MGCSSSKKLVQLPPINSNFTTVHRDDLDDFFKRASKLLQVMETLRQRIVVTKEKCVTLAGTKNLQGLGYSKAVEVLFWSISSCDQGFIYRSNIEVIDKNPYFTLNTVGFPKETIDLVQTVKEYLFILNESSDTLQTAVWQLQQLKEEQIEKKKDIDPKLNSKTKKTIDANMKKLTDGTTISAKVLSQIPEEQKDARELIKYMQGLLATADDLGAKAYTAGKLKPIDIYKWSEAEKRKEEKKARSASKGNGSKSSSPAKGLQPALKNNTDKKEPDSAKRVEFADNKLQNQATIKADLLQEELDEKTFKDDKVFEHQGSIHGHNNLMDDPNEIGIHNFGGLKASQGHAPNSTMNNSQSSPGVSGKGHKYIFVGEKSLEVALRENQVDEQGKIKSSGGYLSPGGRKQAGILQIDENVVDDDDEHLLANDSDALKRFTEKARSYLTTKDE